MKAHDPYAFATQAFTLRSRPDSQVISRYRDVAPFDIETLKPQMDSWRDS